MAGHRVFVTGGTGYMGRRLIPELSRRGHTVMALTRSGSESKLPQGCSAVFGNVLDRSTFAGMVAPADCFVHLVGVPHPSPAKAKQFREIDAVSVREAAHAAKSAGVAHFIYLSVAMPAPVMKEYQAVRAEGEALILELGLNATFVRPWYVLGPRHQWPRLMKPLYWICERIPATRPGALRQGLVTLEEVITALVFAVENPAAGTRIFDVPAIRAASI
jgi:uncharacterized protein YbjT (DUF2867 family)